MSTSVDWTIHAPRSFPISSRKLAIDPRRLIARFTIGRSFLVPIEPADTRHLSAVAHVKTPTQWETVVVNATMSRAIKFRRTRLRGDGVVESFHVKRRRVRVAGSIKGRHDMPGMADENGERG